MHVNWGRRELSFKIVYYGPALSGKTSNLIAIHKRINDDNRSDLVSLETEGDRTLYFDFMQLELGEVAGFKPRVQLYTVPGQIQYEVSRRLVLRGVDGLVFVADSLPSKAEENHAAWLDMQKHLASYNLSLKNIPIAVQLNKRDLPDAVSVDDFRRQIDFDGEFPLFESVAINGEGVFETMRSIISQILGYLQHDVDMATKASYTTAGASR